MGSYDGKVIIVTGGALGMGRATALEFAREGGAVVVADVNQAAGEAIERQMKEAGGKGLFVRADVSKGADCQRVVAGDGARLRRRGCAVQQRRHPAARLLPAAPRTRRKSCGTASWTSTSRATS